MYIRTLYGPISDLDVFALDTGAASRVVLFSRHANSGALLHHPKCSEEEKSKVPTQWSAERPPG